MKKINLLLLVSLFFLVFSNCKKSSDEQTETTPEVPTPTIPKNGLMVYLPFNGNANDESGNGFNGTVVSATLTTDRNSNANKAYSFNGTSSYIVLENKALTTTGIISICAWVKFVGSTNGTIIQKGCWGATWTGWSMGGSISQVGFNVNTSTDVVHTANLNDNKWHFLVAIQNNTSFKLYVDKNLIGTSACASNFNNSTPVSIGARYFTADTPDVTWFFNGCIDDVLIYNRVLTDEEIQTIYTVK